MQTRRTCFDLSCTIGARRSRIKALSNWVINQFENINVFQRTTYNNVQARARCVLRKKGRLHKHDTAIWTDSGWEKVRRWWWIGSEISKGCVFKLGSDKAFSRISDSVFGGWVAAELAENVIMIRLNCCRKVTKWSSIQMKLHSASENGHY